VVASGPPLDIGRVLVLAVSGKKVVVVEIEIGLIFHHRSSLARRTSALTVFVLGPYTY
jgi:hypothetical protein